MHQIFLTSFEDLWWTMKRSSMVFPCPTYCLSSLIVVQFTKLWVAMKDRRSGPWIVSFSEEIWYASCDEMIRALLGVGEHCWELMTYKIYQDLTSPLIFFIIRSCAPRPALVLKLWQQYSWNLGVQVPETVKHVPRIEISDPCDSNQEWLLVFVLVCGLLR